MFPPTAALAAARVFAVVVGYPVEPDCAPGFEPRDDGNCDEIAGFERPPSTMDWLDTFTPCDAWSGDGRLDLEAGCADGVCVDGTRAESELVLGSPVCEPYFLALMRCEWPGTGISGVFRNPDLDAIVDPDETLWILYAHAPFDGTTFDGLGLGAETRCFIDAFEEPDKLRAERVGIRWRLTSVAFGPLSLYDNENPTGARASDGLVDGLSLYSDR